MSYKMGTRSSGTGDLELVPLTGEAPYTGSNAVSYSIVTPLGAYETGTASVAGTWLRGRTVATSSNGNALLPVPMPPSGVVISLTAQVAAVEGEGAGLVDANYGSITVSGSGTVMTINNGAVDTDMLGGDITAEAKDFLNAATAATRMASIGLDTPENAQDALGLGSASLADESAFAADDHSHTLADITDVSLTGVAEGKALVFDASNVAVPTTLSLSNFSSDAIEGSGSNRFVIWDTGTSEYIPTTAAAVLALLGDKTCCPVPPLTTNATDYPICPYMPFAGTVTGLHIYDPAGTCTVNVKIGSTSITGLSAVSVTTTPTTTNATAANTFTLGQALKITVTSAASLSGLVGVVLITRTAG